MIVKLLFLYRILEYQYYYYGSYDCGEQREERPYHIENRVGDWCWIDNGVAHIVGGHACSCKSEEQGYEWAWDGCTKLLRHCSWREDETSGGTTILFSGIVSHIGIHRPQQRRVEANSDRGEHYQRHHLQRRLRQYINNETGYGKRNDRREKHPTDSIPQARNKRSEKQPRGWDLLVNMPFYAHFHALKPFSASTLHLLYKENNVFLLIFRRIAVPLQAKSTILNREWVNTKIKHSL